jgi:hypothetical protein
VRIKVTVSEDTMQRPDRARVQLEVPGCVSSIPAWYGQPFTVEVSDDDIRIVQHSGPPPQSRSRSAVPVRLFRLVRRVLVSIIRRG